jgi:hypothetical protein
MDQQFAVLNNSMGFSANTYSLSALVPVKFTYKFNKEERLSASINSFSSGFKYYRHDAFEGLQDIVLSRKNFLALTDNKPLKDVFDTDSRQISVGVIAGCMFLKTAQDKYFTTSSNNIYAGGTGEKLFINVVPVSENLVELKMGKTKHVQIDENYPYTARLSEEVLSNADMHRQRFEIDFKDGKVSFRTLTKEGYRYLSHGVDQTVRAVGLMLNDTVVNSYLLVPEFVSENSMTYDFDAATTEVKYHNDMTAFADRYTLNVKETQQSSTNLLASCATSDIALSAASVPIPINISLTKTNFSSSGSFSTKRTT